MTFTVTANALPIANLNGPYDVTIGSGITPDLSGSFDPDGLPLVAATYDLDHDGVFGDFTGFGDIPADLVTNKICGGTCVPGVDKTITVRVVDKAGGVAEASATVHFRRDFLLSVTPGNATVNPGGSISFQVGVITSSGFDQPVTLSVPNLPAGVTASFVPPAVTPTATSILTLTAAQNAASFNQAFTVRGTSGAIVHDASSVVDVEFGLIPQCFGVVDVHVVDVETGLPISGATIVNSNTTTDANGVSHVEQRVPVRGERASPGILRRAAFRLLAGERPGRARGVRRARDHDGEAAAQAVRRDQRPDRRRGARPERPRHQPQGHPDQHACARCHRQLRGRHRLRDRRTPTARSPCPTSRCSSVPTRPRPVRCSGEAAATSSNRIAAGCPGGDEDADARARAAVLRFGRRARARREHASPRARRAAVRTDAELELARDDRSQRSGDARSHRARDTATARRHSPSPRPRR